MYEVPCPQLLYPGGGNIPLLPKIDWSDVDGAVSYHLRVFLFGIPIINVRTTKSEYQVLIPLSILTEYNWTVTAEDFNVPNTYCSVMTFTTGW